MIAQPLRLRRWAISSLIVVSLLGQVTQNLNVGYMGHDPEAIVPVRAGGWVVDRLRAGIAEFAFYTGTNTYWRMFSPVHRIDWWWTVTATDPDGHERELTAPDVKAASASSLLVDFREAKFLLNLWTRPSMQAAYLDHRCSEESSSGRPARATRLALHRREILPPEQAARKGDHRATTVTTHVLAQRACS